MDDRCCDQAVPVKGGDVCSRGVRPVPHTRTSKQIHRIPNAVLGQITVKKSREDHDDSPGYAATEPRRNGVTLDGEKCSMNFADLYVRYLGSRARGHKSSFRDRNHLMVLIGQDLPSPSPHAATDENKARKADSRTCYKARKTKRDPEGEEERPCRACRHLDRLSLALFHIANIHHDSPSDEVHDCKHHDPHRIYEVPIKSNYAKSFTLSRIDPTEQGEGQCRD